MTRFFKSIFLLSVFFIGLILYFTVRNVISRYSRHRDGERVFDKIYEDEKVYIRNRLKMLLADLQEGRIRWLLIYSRLYPGDRIQITYSSLQRELNLIQYSRDLSGDEKEFLRQLGANKCSAQRGKIILSTPLNSKIVADLIYFLFENIYNHHKVHNIKINFSGE